MTFTCLSEAEVREKYRRAENKEEMIVVLAGLTDATREEVRSFLGVDAPPKRSQKERVYIDEKEAKRLYELGFSDEAIAERLNVHKTTVRRWRWKNCAPYNPGPPKNGGAVDKRMYFYKQGLNDKEIGEKAGFSKSAVYHWRLKNNLPPNCKRGGHRRKTGGDDS